jgi:hypothetical protein
MFSNSKRRDLFARGATDFRALMRNAFAPISLQATLQLGAGTIATAAKVGFLVSKR